jgi:polar amino acid transport system substrate-binding protein
MLPHMADLTRRILSIVLFLTLAWPLSAQVPEAGGEPGPAGKKLSVIVKPTPPFVMQKAGGVWAGISVDLWRKVAAEQGWEYEFRAVPDIPTLLDEIEAGKADVAVAATTMTAEREKRVDFSHGFFDAGLGIAVPGAKEAPIWTVMARVFSAQFLGVLLLLAALLFGVGALLWFLERRRNREQFGGETRQGLGNGFWWAAVTMTTVGYGDKAPVTLWGRMLALVWMFASIILISTFTAAIASSLTLSQLSTKVQGPGDLGHARVGVIEGTSAEDYCRDNNISPVRICRPQSGAAASRGGATRRARLRRGHYAV